MKTIAIVVLATLCCVNIALCQTETATISGRVTDPSGAAISGADVQVQNVLTGREVTIKTNSSGLYVATAIQPGTYRVIVSNPGFKQLVKPDVILNVQDNASLNFSMTIGSASEIVTVRGGAPLVDTTDATVSTVVDRQFAENLPMNGRSFQTLIELTPGVVVVPTGPADAGQFSVNGQRASSNYWTVDGVSANIGISATNNPGNGLGGALGSFSAFGGTNSLVSIDAMQEFRVQTSTFAPEFGRTPGAQISIVTRSGTNQFHGTVFDYLRNDLFDANDWFANYAHLAKPQERQNDFGGTFGGPIFQDHTFFFFSYEGLRLRLPQVALDTVPDLTARQTAPSSIQPYLEAFPIDPKQPDLGNGVAQYNASYSNAASLDAFSLRLDHRLNSKWSLLGRYNYSPSEIVVRGFNAGPLSVVAPTRIHTQTATVGATTSLSSSLVNDFRFNYSRTDASSVARLDDFGGAVPLETLPFPSPFTSQDSSFLFGVYALKGGPQLEVGRQQQNVQHQFNVVDGLSVQVKQHTLKWGVDFRRLSPAVNPPEYLQNPNFLSMASVEAATPDFSFIESNIPSTFLFRNLGVYVQDNWRISQRVTLTYGIRWDVDFAPSSLEGPSLAAVTGYDLNNLSNLALAPSGTRPFNTTFGNIAPRIGLAYQLHDSSGWQTVLRSGFGIFYDLASSAVGTTITNANYPFGGFGLLFGEAFPFAPPPPPPTISRVNLTPAGFDTLYAFDPHLKLPYSLEWNAALEQGLGDQQSLSASYIGSAGQRLLQSAYILSPNANLNSADLVGNTASSSYNALQLRFQRHLSRGLQSLVSYTWAHSIDNASAGSSFLGSNTLAPALGANANRGPSDFDIRNAFSLGATYSVPTSKTRYISALVRDWAVQSFIIGSSAPPVEVYYDQLSALLSSRSDVRPDLVPGQPLYLFGSQCIQVLGPPCGGGMGFNPAAFIPPPLDPVTGNPVRQGNLGRNALRGFGAFQWDFAVHREFPVHEKVRVQFRAELFNVLNHPNFGQPIGALGGPNGLNPQFGQSQAMLGQSLSGSQFAGSVGNGSLSSLYQMGGPRSVQFALKLMF
jgi:hypothetical protein